MRVIKGIVLFCFSALAVSSCFDPPEFSVVPKLTFNRIRFEEVEGARDSLVLYVDFQDGDGDIGLTPSDYNPPYNELFYYVADGAGDTSKILGFESGNFVYLSVSSGSGTVVTSRTRNTPGYGNLPVYDPLALCGPYKKNGVLRFIAPSHAVEAGTQVDSTFTSGGVQYSVFNKAEALLTSRNKNSYNLEIKYWQYQGGQFVEYDWYSNNKCVVWDARIRTSKSLNPVYTEKPIEGTIRYAMGQDFFDAFGSNTIKISARLRDRALHTSNIVYTQEFVLDEIR